MELDNSAKFSKRGGGSISIAVTDETGKKLDSSYISGEQNQPDTISAYSGSQASKGSR